MVSIDFDAINTCFECGSLFKEPNQEIRLWDISPHCLWSERLVSTRNMGKPYTEAVFDSTANPLNFVIQAIEHTFQNIKFNHVSTTEIKKLLYL